MADIFLSYSREDEARAKNLVSEFEARGWSVFWDRRIPAGQTWRTHIGSALQNARCVVVTWSKHSVESQWVCEEADEGKARGVLVPVLLDPVQPPRGFREIQAADLCNWEPGQGSERLAQLVEDLQRMLGAQRPTAQETKVTEEPVAPTPDSTEHASGRSRKRALVIGGAVLGVLVLGFMVFSYFGNSLRNQTSSMAREFGPDLTASKSSRVEMQEGALNEAKAPAEESQSERLQTESAQPAEPVANNQSGAAAQHGSWLIIAGSFRPTERRRASQVRDALLRAGLQADVVDSNDYPLLTPGLLITRVGPFEQKADASHALLEVRRVVVDAYVKKGR